MWVSGFIFFNNTPRRGGWLAPAGTTAGEQRSPEPYSFTFPKFIPDVTEMLTDVLRTRRCGGAAAEANDKAFLRWPMCFNCKIDLGPPPANK